MTTYKTPGISDELREGIKRIEAEMTAEIEHLGGYGARISGTAPNGRKLIGTLAPAGTPDQRPHLVTSDGRHYALDAYEKVG